MAVVLAAVAAAFAAFVHHERDIGRAEVRALWDADRTRWQAALDKQKADATLLLATETKKAIEAEQRLNDFRNAQEKIDGNHEAIVAGLRGQLSHVRLRDPFAARCGSGGGGAASAPAAASDAGAANDAEAGGVLSERTSADLRQLVFDADTINDAYQSCRAAAVNDRKTP